MSGFHDIVNPVDTAQYKTHGPEINSSSPSNPPSSRIQHLTSFGTSIKFDPTIKVESYMRSLSEMIKAADIYFASGQDEQAYILYLRYLTLAVEKMPLHPGFRDLDSAIKMEIKGNAGKVLTRADTLKHKLLQKFTQEHEKYLSEEEIRQKIRESEEERLKQLDNEQDVLKIQRLELEKKQEELRIQERKLNGRLAEVEQERKVLLEKRKQYLEKGSSSSLMSGEQTSSKDNIDSGSGDGTNMDYSLLKNEQESTDKLHKMNLSDEENVFPNN